MEPSPLKRYAVLVLASLAAVAVIVRAVNSARAARFFDASIAAADSPRERLRLLEEAARLDPGNAVYLRDAGGRCLEIAQDDPALADEMFHKAKQYLVAAVHAEPSSAPAHYQLGHYCFIRRDFRRAEEEFDKALMLAPCNANFFHLVAQRDLERRKIRRWVVEFRRAIALEPRRTVSILTLLWTASDNDPYALRDLAGDSWTLRVAVTRFLRDQGERAAAVSDCIALCRQADDVPEETREQLSALLRSMNEHLLAVAFLDRWLKKAPSSFLLRREYASALASGGDLPRSLEIAQALVAECPHDEPSLFLLGDIQERTGNPADAESTFQSLIGLAPRNVGYHLRLIELYRRQNRLADALDACDRLVQLAPRSPEAHAARGAVQLANKDVAAALLSYEQAARLAPWDKSCRETVENLQSQIANATKRD